MKIYLATDHAGFELKEKMKAYLLEKGYQVEDCGAATFDKDDDYPDFISKAAQAVSQDQTARGIVFGGSGQGEAMTANKFPNVRAAVFYKPALPIGAADAAGRTSTDPFEMVRLSREHNDANILSLSARFLTEEEAKKAVSLWLEVPFTKDPRHMRRIEKIKQFENRL